MYHALLTNRYLTTRVIPFIAVAAVSLCTALVIIVVSVMTGFVNMVRDAGKTLMGDVIISYPLHGMTHYDELIERIEALPEASAATPMVDMPALLELPYDHATPVQVFGVEPIGFDQVTGYAESVYWKPPSDKEWVRALRNITREIWEQEEEFRMLPPEEREFLIPLFDEPLYEEAKRASSDPMRRTLYGLATRTDLPPENRQAILRLETGELREKLPDLLGREMLRTLSFYEPMLRTDLDLYYQQGRLLNEGGENGEAMVTGIHVSEGNKRRRDGTYRVVRGGLWMPENTVTLTMAPISRGHRILQPKSRILPVANEVQFGIYHVDSQRVLIPLETAQQMLDMDAGRVVDPDVLDPETLEPVVREETPARVTHILVRAANGVNPTNLRTAIEGVYDAFFEELLAASDRFPIPPRAMPGTSGTGIATWEQQNAAFIGPVEKERDLMRILFSIVYFVCAGLVLVIFWAIVYEKTRDIGILRSIGASRAGVLWIFVRYGLVVGIVGSIVGLGLAYLVVHNINHIHNALGEPFPLWARATALTLTGASLLATLYLLTRDSLLPVVGCALATIALAGLSTGMMLHKGFLVWDPQVYYFSEIPNRIDMTNAIITMVGAVVFSIIGALFPAARAADIDPVSALRYE